MLADDLREWQEAGIDLSRTPFDSIGVHSGVAHLAVCHTLERPRGGIPIHALAELLELEVCGSCLPGALEMSRVASVSLTTDPAGRAPDWLRRAAHVETVRVDARDLRAQLRGRTAPLARLGRSVQDLVSDLGSETLTSAAGAGEDVALLLEAARREVALLHREARLFLEAQWRRISRESRQEPRSGEREGVVNRSQAKRGEVLVELSTWVLASRNVLADLALLGEVVATSADQVVLRVGAEHWGLASAHDDWPADVAELMPGDDAFVECALRLWQDGGEYSGLEAALAAARCL